MLSFNQYQNTAHKHALYKDDMYPWLALAEETGELLGRMAKIKRGDRDSDYDKIFKECGDVLWNLSEICTQMGFALEDVADANLAKLYYRTQNDTIKGDGDDR